MNLVSIGTIGAAIRGMVCADRHIHLAAEADPCYRYLKGAHAYARRLDGQVVAAGHEEIQAHALLGVGRVSGCDGVERAVEAAHGIAK